jgi:hypothetical protein
VDPRIGLIPVKKIKISCPQREFNHDHLVVQSVARRCTQTVPQFISKFGVLVLKANIVGLLRSSADHQALFAEGHKCLIPSHKLFQKYRSTSILGIFTTFKSIGNAIG